MDESSKLVDCKDISFTLPWPPSVNHYWRRCGNRYFVSQEGKNYREIVIIKCNDSKGFFKNKEKLSVSILAYPPDKRRRDLDNVLKSLLDSLQHAGVYEDDYQIDCITIERLPYQEGKVIISIKEIP